MREAGTRDERQKKNNISLHKIVEDKSEYKKAVKELKKSEELFKKSFENLPVLAYNIDLNGRIVNCNRIVVKTLGYKIKKALT